MPESIATNNLQPYPTATTPAGAQYQDMSSFLDDHLLAELGWTNSNNFLYPPAPGIPGPYGADWYSPPEANGFSI